MRAVILLTANAGFAEGAKREISRIAQGTEEVKVENAIYCLGRFDGVLLVNFEEIQDAVLFVEAIRKDGRFRTETLFEVD